MVDGKISLRELYELKQQLYDAPGGETWLKFDGVEYDTDLGYAWDGIEYFFQILERRVSLQTEEQS